MKKSYCAAACSNRSCLSYGSIDLTVNNNAASTIVIHTGNISRSINDSTIGYTIKVKLEYTLRRVGVGIIKRYAFARSKHDSGLLVCGREIGILNSEITGFEHTLGVHLDTADISERTTIYKDICIAVCPHTVSIM